MTHIGYVKPSMFPHFQGPSHNRLTTGFTLLFTYPLLGFSRLQGITEIPFPGWEPEHSLGFFPFSARVTSTRQTRFQPRRFSSPGFLNLTTSPNADNNLQVYSTLQALLGSGSSELYLMNGRQLLSSHLLLRHYPPYTASFRRLAAPRCTSPQRNLLTCDLARLRPLVY
jgi:hypothetical protein